MKVNNKSGVEINVRDAVLALKKKYETLQGQTLTTVGNISSYSSVQQVCHAVYRTEQPRLKPPF